MNKIILDKEKNININVVKDSICDISKDNVIEVLNIKLSDNVKFIINHYNEITENSKLNINIIQNNNTEFIYNHNFMNNKIYDLNIFIELNGDYSKNIINIKGISNSGNSNITIDGKVFDNTKDNELDEKVRMLNINEGKTSILPNMYINTKNVIANHAASITNINSDYLFYLNTKCIKNEEAKKIIIDGFLDKEKYTKEV